MHVRPVSARMHFVQDSAEIVESPRERRRLETERALARGARLLTAEVGLNGFTIEQVCEAAGVSRRTFFNYFASKEDAVLGIPAHRGDADAEAAFLAGGDPSAADLSPTLLDDLAALAAVRWARMDVAPETAAELFAAVEREPRLLPRVVQHVSLMERSDAVLVERREGLPEGDLRAALAAQLIGLIGRSATEAFLTGLHVRSFEALYAERLVAARDLFATQTIHTGSRS
jgi:AcrR family transcriptional regulator